MQYDHIDRDEDDDDGDELCIHGRSMKCLLVDLKVIKYLGESICLQSSGESRQVHFFSFR